MLSKVLVSEIRGINALQVRVKQRLKVFVTGRYLTKGYNAGQQNVSKETVSMSDVNF